MPPLSRGRMHSWRRAAPLRHEKAAPPGHTLGNFAIARARIGQPLRLHMRAKSPSSWTTTRAAAAASNRRGPTAHEAASGSSEPALAGGRARGGSHPDASDGTSGHIEGQGSHSEAPVVGRDFEKVLRKFLTMASLCKNIDQEVNDMKEN